MTRHSPAAGRLTAVWACLLAAAPAPAGTFILTDYGPQAEPGADATPPFRRLFAAVAEAGGGTVVIPPGDYHLPGAVPIPLSSHTRVTAHGARFFLPDRLGDKARVVLFQGENVRDFSWAGGSFHGHCFDPAAESNAWEPNANTRVFVVTTAPGGVTDDITFHGLRSDGVAGAVVSVYGALESAKSEGKVLTFATNVTVADCTLLASGKFMWDYGYLWQITVWPEDFSDRERGFAAKYFRHDMVRGGLTMADGSDRVAFDNSADPLPVARTGDRADALCFFGDTLPRNVTRGKQLFVVESRPDSVKVSETPGGRPLVFEGAAGGRAKLVHNHLRAFHGLYAPLDGGPGKGGVDVVGGKGVRITGCRLSARGDTMHVQRCHNVVFANNQILGSRMGAFFLAEYCKNATITGNTVDGTNGSRVMSVERSCEDVTIVGNTFRNGGRGSWINQPRNFVLADNVFVNNTTKCEPDPRRGRRTYLTGEYERYAEVYFTTYEPDGRYGNVIVRGNVFVTGPEASQTITFAPGGDSVIVEGNIFSGPVRSVVPPPGAKDVTIRGNLGLPHVGGK